MAENQILEGVARKDKVALQSRQIDTRPFLQKMKDVFENNSTVAYFFLGIIVLFSIGYDLSLRFLDVGLAALAVYMLVIVAAGSARTLSFRTPMSSGTLYPNYKKNEATYLTPSGDKADGLLFFGVDVENIYAGEELWLSDDDIRKHMLLFGTTGAGKSEALLSLCFGALLWCSGFLFSDGKGTFELYYKVYNTCRKLGQEDDLLLMSFLTGKEDRHGATSQKISNTLNPVAKASEDAASQLIISLMASNGGGSGDMWAERAGVLMESVMGLLVWKRDYRKIPISIDSIRDTLVLSNYFSIWENSQKEESKDDEFHSDFIPAHIFKSMNGYLVSLPGFSKTESYEKQPPSVNEQHGFLFMQFSRLLGSLADMYGYIFNTQLSEIDFWDVVVNRRVLVVLLPALAKSKQELSMLGKIVIACIKQMMSSGLGTTVEGLTGDMLKANATRSRTPFITILDEFGYYAVAGSAVMPAQARSLGFFMIFAGQDFAAFSASGKEEAEAIVANCKLQVCMALQDEKSTYDIFHKKAGQATVYVSAGKTHKDGKLISQDGVQTESKDVITFNDLSRQKQGYAHFILEGTLARGRFFYAAIPLLPKHQIVVNQFVKVAPPPMEEVKRKTEVINKLYNSLINKNYTEMVYDDVKEDINFTKMQRFGEFYDKYLEQYKGNHLFANIATIAHHVQVLHKKQIKKQAEKEAITNGFKNHQTSFVKSDASYYNEFHEFQEEQKDIGKKAVKPFGQPIAFLEENLEDIALLAGVEDNTDQKTSNTLSELNRTTAYPKTGTPENIDNKSMASLLKECTEEAIK